MFCCTFFKSILKMSLCSGDGLCLSQCECVCYNVETEEYNEICNCGHREHDGYCPTNCCNPVECRNYKYCQRIHPKWLSLCHKGLCINCAVQMGKHTYTLEEKDCCVCLESKRMLVLQCNHEVCNDCWYNITKNFKKPLCPLCRHLNDWSPC